MTSPSRSARFDFAAGAFTPRWTPTTPSAISFWICAREWLSRTETRKRSSRCPSYSVGTVNSSGSTGSRDRSAAAHHLLGRRRRAALQPQQHGQAEWRQDHRDELRRRQAEHLAAWVAAIDLDDEARDGVQ